MNEIISYKMCAVKVRNAKLRNYLKDQLILKIVYDKNSLSYFFGCFAQKSSRKFVI